MFTNDIAAVMTGAMGADLAIDRIELQAAVARQIVCLKTERVLDVRDAVYFHVTGPAGNTGADVVDADWFDGYEPELRTVCQERGITLRVLDGRKLFGARR
ncbi:hypothetical protein ACFWYW_23695 [Nonomuraea sp. NPDC059023]|uniref:hypothetical protein n=1 Tax=unclassified Nonomuraea TaxID=2593643 RepID=UPI0036B4BBE5